MNEFMWGLQIHSSHQMLILTMRDCLLNQSEANGPRRDHVTFATLWTCRPKRRIFYCIIANERAWIQLRSDFKLLRCILNIDSPENRLAECLVRLYSHPTSSGAQFACSKTDDELTSCGFWRSESCLQSLQNTKEVIANLTRLFG